MRIIYNKFLPPKGFVAINLFGILFARKGAEINQRVINHESIHTAQMKELLFIGFYVLYLLEWIIRLLQYRFKWHTAYRNISFEREAYANDFDFLYLTEKRKPYNFIKHLNP